MQRHSLTSLESALSLANGRSWGVGGGGWGEVCFLRSLTAEKILFTGRQTCFLYLVLWLCATAPTNRSGHKTVFKCVGRQLKYLELMVHVGMMLPGPEVTCHHRTSHATTFTQLNVSLLMIIYLSIYILIKVWSSCLIDWGRAYESWIRNGSSKL